MKLGIGKAIGLLALGAGLIVAGVAMVYPPAAFILGGGALVAGTLWGVDV
jgi:hypothetical protein